MHTLNLLHRYFLISVIILLLSSKLLLSFETLSFLTYLDELLLLYLFVVIFYSFAVLKLDRYVLYITITICYMILISVLMNSSSMKNIVLQSFIHMKFFIFYFVVDKYLKYGDLRKIGWFLFVFTIFGLFLNILLQETFNNILSQSVDYRSGFLRVGGFQQNANLLGLILGLFYLFLLLCGNITKKNMLLITIIFSLLIFVTGSRSSFVIIVIGISYYYLFGSVKSKIYMVPAYIILLVGLFGILGYSDMLDRTMSNILTLENAGESGYIRGIMLVSGFQLFCDYFPIGTGAATFGSVLSEGSYIYYVLGLSDKSFFLNMSGIYDSNLATIGGEFGFIGIFIYSFLLIFIYKEIKNENNKPYLLSVITAILVLSVTNPIFMNAYPAILFVIALVYEKKKAALHESSRQRCNEINPYSGPDRGSD
jgi:hypothetical protein